MLSVNIFAMTHTKRIGGALLGYRWTFKVPAEVLKVYMSSSHPLRGNHALSVGQAEELPGYLRQHQENRSARWETVSCRGSRLSPLERSVSVRLIPLLRVTTPQRSDRDC
jgi:hypothetical protein